MNNLDWTLKGRGQEFADSVVTFILSDIPSGDYPLALCTAVGVSVAPSKFEGCTNYRIPVPTDRGDAKPTKLVLITAPHIGQASVAQFGKISAILEGGKLKDNLNLHIEGGKITFTELSDKKVAKYRKQVAVWLGEATTDDEDED